MKTKLLPWRRRSQHDDLRELRESIEGTGWGVLPSPHNSKHCPYREWEMCHFLSHVLELNTVPTYCWEKTAQCRLQGVLIVSVRLEEEELPFQTSRLLTDRCNSRRQVNAELKVTVVNSTGPSERSSLPRLLQTNLCKEHHTDLFLLKNHCTELTVNVWNQDRLLHVMFKRVTLGALTWLDTQNIEQYRQINCQRERVIKFNIWTMNLCSGPHEDTQIT